MDLIESYFAVAQHLQVQADTYAQSAKLLNDMACAMSEERMRIKQAGCVCPPEMDPLGCEADKCPRVIAARNK